MTCIQECQTFLWGGTGTHVTDDAGRCSCACGGEEWSEFNILGTPSCVPILAHVIFGAVGLACGVVGMCHAAYQLHRQVQFHAIQIAASASPVEECRRHLHVTVIIHDFLSLWYFFMVLVLGGNQLWMSTIVLAGLTQFTANIGGILTVRMWIYTNDPRLIKDSPEILAISEMLERPLWRSAAYVLFCIGAGAATVLAAVRRSQAAVKVATGGFIFTVVVANAIILECGTSLIRTINASLRNKPAPTQRTAGGASEASTRRGDDCSRKSTAAWRRKERNPCNLMAARKKARIAMSVCVTLGVATTPLQLFAIFSGYGTAAPLLFFGAGM